MTPTPAQPDDSYPKLLSLAVHEFRTPASVVSGYLRMLQRDTESPLTDRHRKMVEEAEKSCVRIVALVTELSDIGKLDAGLVTMAREPLDVFALAREVAEGMHEADEREVHVEVRGTATGANMTGDISRLRQALHAIFRAIVRETVGPATVVVDRRVVASGAATSAVIVVAEAGGVQAAYDAPRGVFDDRRGGMGLALPLARRVIEAHQGQLWSPAFVTDSGAARPASAAGPEAAARGAAAVAFPVRS